MRLHRLRRRLQRHGHGRPENRRGGCCRGCRGPFRQRLLPGLPQRALARVPHLWPGMLCWRLGPQPRRWQLRCWRHNIFYTGRMPRHTAARLNLPASCISAVSELAHGKGCCSVQVQYIHSLPFSMSGSFRWLDCLPCLLLFSCGQRVAAALLIYLSDRNCELSI